MSGVSNSFCYSWIMLLLVMTFQEAYVPLKVQNLVWKLLLPVDATHRVAGFVQIVLPAFPSSIA